MKLKSVKEEFIKTLANEYPVEEVHSFFTILTENYLNFGRLDLALAPEKDISIIEAEQFKVAQRRLLNHEPIQHIVGKTSFFGLEIKVNRNVLIPRPETEELVGWIIDDFSSAKKRFSILDIGTGSGCIAISLAKHFIQAKVSAMDVSELALEIARTNAKKNKVKVRYFQQDILKIPSLGEKLEVIVSNPPYVRELEKREMQRNVLDYEPRTALYVKDENPLVFYEKITKLALSALNPGGTLYFEINQYLAKETENMMRTYGFITELRKDIFGNFRMLKGEKPGR